jgi:uncharacterized protein (TIGR00251 family)
LSLALTSMPPTTLRIKVKPRSKLSDLAQNPDGNWTARLKSPPVDGKANEELIRLVAEKFDCGRAAVTILAGAGGRMKLVRVEASYPRL